jgi:hypothetical protein
MKQGWKKNLTIYVRINKRYRRGKLKSKNGAKWNFLPDGYRKTIRVCPIKDLWHYRLAVEHREWTQKLKVLFLDDKPFKLQRERYGAWRGAKTGRTKPRALRVWQITGTSDAIVGHLGRYTLAVSDGQKLIPFKKMPLPTDSFFLGRGPLNPRQFKTLKIVCRHPRPKMDRLRTIKPLYKIPLRNELGDKHSY